MRIVLDKKNKETMKKSSKIKEKPFSKISENKEPLVEDHCRKESFECMLNHKNKELLEEQDCYDVDTLSMLLELSETEQLMRKAMKEMSNRRPGKNLKKLENELTHPQNSNNPPSADIDDKEAKETAENLASLAEIKIKLDKIYEREFDMFLLENFTGGSLEDISTENLVKIMKNAWTEKESLKEEAKAQKYEKVVEEIQKRILERIKKDKDPKKSIQTLFQIWADWYDEHMLEHEMAMEMLLIATIELVKKGFLEERIFQGTFLEMSCGTGTTLEIIYRNLTEELKKNLSVILNDLSPEMLEKAKNKLASQNCRCIETTMMDMCSKQFLEKYKNRIDTIMLAQTLHLITDPDEIKKEHSPSPYLQRNEHRKIKRIVIQNAFEMLKSGGHFILIDEWEPQYSDKTGGNPLEKIVGELFDETFRPIRTRDVLKDNIMTNIEGARFVAEFKTPIDKKHSMYIMVYKKDELKKLKDARNLPEDRVFLPSTEEELEKFGLDQETIESAREKAIEKVIGMFKVMDKNKPKFQPAQEELKDWITFESIEDDFVINPKKDELRTKKYSTIILSKKLHKTTLDELAKWLDNAVGALRIGGALIIIDEWEVDKKQYKEAKHKKLVRNRLLEKYYQDRIIFGGAVRVPILTYPKDEKNNIDGFDAGMYGYLYRKIR